MAKRVGYFFSETATNLKRNLLMTLAAVTTVWVSLFLLGGAMMFGQFVTHVAGQWEGKVELSVFLRDEITPQQTKELGGLVSGMPEVKTVIFESKAEAYKEYQDMFRDQPSLIENVDPDALPASYRIKLKDPKTAEAVSTRLQGRPGVDEVQFGGDAVKKLLKVTGLIRTFVIGMTIILLIAATLLIANSIRLAVYARRKEIGIMKLVGATNWFIRVPFIIEGMSEAAIGAILATGVLYGGKYLFLDKLHGQIPFLPVGVDNLFVLQVFGALLAVGMVIGAIGSSLALRRFLEV